MWQPADGEMEALERRKQELELKIQVMELEKQAKDAENEAALDFDKIAEINIADNS